MPAGSTYPSAVYSPINHKVYVFGGVINMVSVTNTRVYDIATNQWSAGAAMPAPRDSMAAGYYNGRIYLVGGKWARRAIAALGIRSMADSWNTSRLAIPQPVASPASG